MVKEQIIKGLKIFILGAVAIFIFGFITMELWNWLMPEIFGLTTICWGQAMGLLVLSKIFFGFGRGGKRCCAKEKVKDKVKRHLGWKEKVKERYDNMSDEEKEKMKDKCSSWFDPDKEC